MITATTATTMTMMTTTTACSPTDCFVFQRQQCYLGPQNDVMECVVETLAGNRARFCIPTTTTTTTTTGGAGGAAATRVGLRDVIWAAVEASLQRDYINTTTNGGGTGPVFSASQQQQLLQSAHLLHEGRILDEDKLVALLASSAGKQQHQQQQEFHNDIVYFQLRLRLFGGMDRQNRVGSKFGGGGVSSTQQSERERKERLKRLALESIDLAKDPYLVRNHLGSLECKLCLTLHRDEANYLAHTQGKKHQAGLAKRAHLEKLQQEREAASSSSVTPTGAAAAVATDTTLQQQKKVRIGRPAYQVFKSREAETHQRCLSFELMYPEIEAGLQPRHRFMSAFEQRIETPPDRRYQYLLFAADPYETVAFKIPNEPIDKGENRFVTHWDEEHKKFIVTLYFLEPTSTGASTNTSTTSPTATTTTTATA